MANKYRIGTSIGIQMNISNMPSETANIFVRSEYGTFDMDNVSVLKNSGGNPIGIKGSFAGANQKYVGKYDVIVICSTRRLCVDNAFELVKHSDEADTVETTTVDLNFTASYLTFPTVVSGYEEWRQDHDGTIEDYWKFVRDEPRIVQIETNVANNAAAIKANADAIKAETERATTAETELGDAIDAEKERAEAAEKQLSDDLWRNTPTEIGLDEDTGEVYATFRTDSTVNRTYIAEDCELVAEIDEVGVNEDGELWSDIVVN